MSAFVVSKKTMQKCVIGFYRAGLMPESDEALTSLGRLLYEMNAGAVGIRYRTQETPPSFVFESTLCSDIEIYKSLRCLLYQCSEGRIVETDLFQKLQRVAETMAKIIIEKSEAYQNAPWDG